VAQLDDWSMVLIHGTPEPGRDFRRQLAAFRALSLRFGISPFNYDWGTAFKSQPVEAVRDLRAGRFGGKAADDFDKWLQRQAATQPGGKFIIIGYSLGGFIFYNWIARQPTDSPLLRSIRFAVTIAAPYQFSTGSISFPQPGGRLRSFPGLPLQRVAPEALAERLGRRLLAIQASDDPVIIAADSNLAASAQVRHVTVPIPKRSEVMDWNSHRDVRTDPETLLVTTAAMARELTPRLVLASIRTSGRRPAYQQRQSLQIHHTDP
jgi:pimeloyl-ACP methyl ester carboxylesterase